MKKTIISGLLVMFVLLVLGGAALAAGYQDGEYIGYVPDEHGDVVVAVAIKDGYISNVEIISPIKHEYPYEAGKTAYYEYPAKVISKQSADIEVVSGATSSYTDYNEAVQMALDMASGTYKGNTFYGLSRDYAHGHILLAVTFNDDKTEIVDVKYITKNPDVENDTLMEAKTDKYPHEAAIKAFNELPVKAVESQKVEADIVSGATHISVAFYNAFLMAVTSAGADF